MNKYQKYILMAVGAVLLLMLLYPPFQFVGPRGTLNKGYSFIASPPLNGNATVNVSQLLLQMLVVGVVGALGFLVTKDKQ
jgi:hypothetical protein